MSRYILGIDGGATKSHLAIFSDSGSLAGCETYSELNHEVMEGSYCELEERLAELLPRVFSDAGIGFDDIDFAVFGLAGIDTKAQEDRITDIIRRIGVKHFLACNDAVLGVPAGCPDGIGICAINGTGFKLAAVDYNGAIIDTCGMGTFTDDRGGGTWYGGRACSEVYNALFKLGRPTKMREMLFELMGIESKYEYAGAVNDIFFLNEPSAEFRVALNSIPFKAAALGDEVALGILDESAVHYGGAIARIAMDMYFPCDRVLHVTFAGSVFVKQKDSVLHEMIKRHVAEILGEREVRYTIPDAPPVAGAVLLAAQKAGFEIDPAAVKAALRGL